jgi:hypothetical protein
MSIGYRARRRAAACAGNEQKNLRGGGVIGMENAPPSSSRKFKRRCVGMAMIDFVYAERPGTGGGHARIAR